MNVDLVPIDSLNPAAYNPRRMDDATMARLVDGIREFGLVQPIVVNRQGMTIIGGHQRLKAAREAGLDQVPVMWVDLEPSKEKALNLALNKIDGDWDENLLRQLLRDIDPEDTALTGFSETEVDELLAELASDEFQPQCDQDEVPNPEETAISQPGEIWHLGRHSILCGDSTDIAAVMDFLGGRRADMVFTDPPYLMDFTGAIGGDGETNRHARNHGRITNDKMSRADGDQFLRDICATINTTCRGAWYVCFYRLGIDRILAAINDQRMKWRNVIIWRKNSITLSNSDYKSTYEPVIYGFSDDYTPIVYGWNEHDWFGPKNERDAWDIGIPSIWEVQRTRKNELHPTMKPVDLVERALLNSSRAGQTVLDLFGGSGSTIIAAEKSGRTCRAVEIEPKYVDVMIRRWQNYTGWTARRSDGITFNELFADAG